MTQLVTAMREELGEWNLGIPGRSVRPIGRVASNDSLTHGDHHPVVIAEYDLADAG